MKGALTRAIQVLAGQKISQPPRYMHLSPNAVESAIRILDDREIVYGFGAIFSTGSTVVERKRDPESVQPARTLDIQATTCDRGKGEAPPR